MAKDRIPSVWHTYKLCASLNKESSWSNENECFTFIDHLSFIGCCTVFFPFFLPIYHLPFRFTADAQCKKKFNVVLFSLFCRIFKWHIWMNEYLILLHKYDAVRCIWSCLRVNIKCLQHNILFFIFHFFFSQFLYSLFSLSLLISFFFFFVETLHMELFQPFKRLKPDLCVCGVVWYGMPHHFHHQ